MEGIPAGGPYAEWVHDRWIRVGAYMLAGGLGAFAWMASAADRLLVPLTTAQEDTIGGLLVLDALLGFTAMGLLPVRRRRPLGVAVTLSALSALSVSSLGAAGMAVVSASAHRRRRWVVLIGCVAGTASLIAASVHRASAPAGAVSRSGTVAEIVFGLVLFGAAVVIGLYLGARRELLDSLRQQALTAAGMARESERTRIAREMHDALAHRISLVVLHAGALEYRTDLDRAQTAETATVIQTNAQLALIELRQVLGVLRADAAEPQPTLAELPALLSDAREAGTPITYTTGIGGRGLPEPLSCATFRIVQEALTNARKHAPGQPVAVRLDGAPGGTLTIEVRNATGRHKGAAVPGVGLVGLTERAQLAGGTLMSGRQLDGSFVVLARLPWPS